MTHYLPMEGKLLRNKSPKLLWQHASQSIDAHDWQIVCAINLLQVFDEPATPSCVLTACTAFQLAARGVVVEPRRDLDHSTT